MPIQKQNWWQDTVEYVLTTVKENPGLGMNGLAQKVCQENQIKNEVRVKSIIRSLVACGRLEAMMNGQGNCRNIKYKELQYSDGGKNPEVERMENILKDAQRKFKEVTDELKSERDAAKKQAAETTAQSRVVKVQLLQGKKKKKEIEGLFHEKFETILQLAQARKNIFIYGPTGSGKSFLCKQVAESLGLSYAFVSCTSGMSESVLGGKLLPIKSNGSFDYVTSEFIEAYENGGLFLLDEVDAADANVMLFINAALAGNRVNVPNRPNKPYAEKHKDFVCIAAANTLGTGTDRMYSGRNSLDEAFLDRFKIGKVHIDYDQLLEAQVCPDDELRERLLKYRKAINAHRLERAMSTRFMIDAYDMKNEFEWSDEAVDTAFFCGWREDEINKVKMHN